MGGEWQTLSLGEIYQFSSGLSKPRSSFGSGHPFLSFKDVFYSSVVPNQLSELVQSTEQERERCSVRRGDVFLTRTSETMDELGMSCVALTDIPNATFNGFTKRLRPRAEQIAPEFARYYFRSSKFRASVNSMSTMSTRASLNNEMLERLTITFPEFAEQEAIGHILGSLDDKIELNRRRNQTLEAMARALFQDWFVDFGPVRTKMEGREPYLPAELWRLFPERLDETGKPAGWETSTLGEICTKHGGFIQTGPFGSSLHASDYLAEGVPVVMPQDLSVRRIEIGKVARVSEENAERLSRHRLQEGDVIFSRRGDVARHALVTHAESGWLCGTGCLLVRPGNGSGVSTYVSRAVARAEAADWLLRHAVGAVMPNLNTRILSALPMLATSSEVLAAFEAKVGPIEALISANNSEADSLATLRDTLLPKLISGELRVADAEKFVEHVGP